MVVEIGECGGGMDKEWGRDVGLLAFAAVSLRILANVTITSSRILFTRHIFCLHTKLDPKRNQSVQPFPHL